MNTKLYMLIQAALVAIPVSVTIRVIICLILMVKEPEQADMYKKRAEHSIIYAVVAESIVSLLYLAKNYFS